MQYPHIRCTLESITLMYVLGRQVWWQLNRLIHNSLSQEQEAMEWNGFNNQLSRTQGVLKPTTTYLYVRSLIDVPPSHPDTILTTLTYMQRSLVDMGMKYIHLSIDMQLFAVTKHVLACGNFSDTSSLKLVV